MCGIVGAIAQRPVKDILIEGLKRLEYRGYDSAGIALHQGDQITRVRAAGKVVDLETAAEELIQQGKLDGKLGIAHTRWATHGKPTERNAHPHISFSDNGGPKLAIVHNGIIENYEIIREELKAKGYEFTSDTDTEVVAHLLNSLVASGLDLMAAVQAAVAQFEGAYALGVIELSNPERLICARLGSPLVIGVGSGENFIASDALALLQVTDRFIYLEDGDVAELTLDSVSVFNSEGDAVEYPVTKFEHGVDSASKGEYRHYMLKEIYEQPEVVKKTLEGRISQDKLLEQAFGPKAAELFDQTKAVQIVACGTSYHSGLVAKYWIEELAGIPCNIEVASEYRYRKTVLIDGTLFITISQSGETADTLAALKEAKKRNLMGSLVVCNVPGSSLVRESDLCILTNAGPEIGVASTKAFTTQLVSLLMISIALARRNGLPETAEAELIRQLHKLPDLLSDALKLDDAILNVSEQFADKQNALFLGRGIMYPVALEGALKLKEISYIHAEAYPAGELKHGPLALVDADMPVVTVAPNNELLDKLRSNLEEVRARGGQLFVVADDKTVGHYSDDHTITLNEMHSILEPIVFTIPLQLLSYHVAVLKGTDVDQPRNLAKSVTVE